MGQHCSFCAPGSKEEVKSSAFDTSIDKQHNTYNNNNNNPSKVQSISNKQRVDNNNNLQSAEEDNEQIRIENERKKQKEQERLQRIVLLASREMVPVNNNNNSSQPYYNDTDQTISSIIQNSICNVMSPPMPSLYDTLPKTNVEVNTVMDILSLQNENHINNEQFSKSCVNELMEHQSLLSLNKKDNGLFLFHGLQPIVENLP